MQQRNIALPQLAQRQGRQLAPEFLRNLLKVRLAGVGLLIIAVLVLSAVLADKIAPYTPIAQHAQDQLAPPSSAYLMGTDQAGRDMLSRIIYGAQVSLLVGIIAVGIAVIVGVPLGLISGYYGGKLDDVIMRIMDAVLSIPTIILALAIVAALGPGLVNVMIAIGVTSTPVYARLVRASTLSVRERDYITAAKANGAKAFRIIFIHTWPNVTAPIIVQGSLGMAFAVLAEASLSFLGIGVPPPTPTWGGMLQSGFPYLELAPWLAMFPGLAIFLTVLAFNFVGDALRDVLDPRLGRALGLR
ncbi:MAG: ABC transporter permease [Chloroflexi bacterium]|nr:ABC transporter permease [Chloroflexota bacterium]